MAGEHQTDVKRPAKWMLQLLGLWQPMNGRYPLKVYSCVSETYIMPICVAAVLLSMGHFDKKFVPGLLVNGFTTALNVCFPFVFCRWYFYRGNYNELLTYANQAFPETLKKLTFRYSLLSVVLWIAGGLFFFLHWYLTGFMTQWYIKVVFGTAIFFSLGWWASWMSIYGFVCHLHCTSLKLYKARLSQQLGTCSRTELAENQCSVDMLREFNEMDKRLKQTQSDLSKIISLSVAYHILDVFVFSTVYFLGEFGKHFELLYYGGLTFDLFSILMKLYPAAKVCENIKRIVRTAGRHCYACYDTRKILKPRMLFYEHISLREQIMGFTILGMKINSKFMIGVFFTVTLTLLRFVSMAKDKLKEINFL